MRLLHGRVPIELHTLSPGEGRPLLLLHALGSNSEAWSSEFRAWSLGPVFAVDFAGHGKSGHIKGSGYYPEYFLADADLALQQIDEPCAIVGAGIGAYTALLLAGSRPDQVPGALLLDGEGLMGVGSLPDNDSGRESIESFEQFVADASKRYASGTDPLVAQCDRDLRPLDYVRSFAHDANPLLFSESVTGADDAPDWWTTALEVNGGISTPAAPAAALEALAALVAQ